jgi:hypothetical protein
MNDFLASGPADGYFTGVGVNNGVRTIPRDSCRPYSEVARSTDTCGVHGNRSRTSIANRDEDNRANSDQWPLSEHLGVTVIANHI